MRAPIAAVWRRGRSWWSRLCILPLLFVGACANQAAPPGGPPDSAPPRVLRITPENNVEDVRLKVVALQFDEVVSESPRGGRDLRDLFFISPKSGATRVNWNRTRLEVRPTAGWKPNTVYSIVMRPGLQDLRNNVIDTTISIVFSTGGPIPLTQVSGVVFDWVAGRGAPNAIVEAIAEDSTAYQVVADSSGRYQLRYLPAGPYLMRAFSDRNNNRELEPLESWDTVRVTVTADVRANFYAFPHDTVGLRIANLAVEDSNRVIRVTFDKPYAPEQQFTAAGFVVRRADSSIVRVRSVATVPERLLADSLRAQTRPDSSTGAARNDSTPAQRVRADSLARVRRADSVANAGRLAREARRLVELRTGRISRDTLPAPKIERPMLYTEVYLSLETALAPESQYRVEARDVRSLSGQVRSPARTLATPRTPRDTTGRR